MSFQGPGFDVEDDIIDIICKLLTHWNVKKDLQQRFQQHSAHQHGNVLISEEKLPLGQTTQAVELYKYTVYTQRVS